MHSVTRHTSDEKVSADLHKGAFPVEFKRSLINMFTATNADEVFEVLPNLTPNLTWTKCHDSGVLHIAEQQNNAFSNHLNNEDKSYHVLDYSLFYGNIRQNAIDRTQAHLDTK